MDLVNQGQFQSKRCPVCLVLLEHNHTHFIYILSVAALGLQWQSGVIVAKTVRLAKPKIVTIWPPTDNMLGFQKETKGTLQLNDNYPVME